MSLCRICLVCLFVRFADYFALLAQKSIHGCITGLVGFRCEFALVGLILYTIDLNQLMCCKITYIGFILQRCDFFAVMHTLEFWICARLTRTSPVGCLVSYPVITILAILSHHT